MEIIYWAIVGLIVGAVVNTIWGFLWKKRQGVPFDSNYVVSMLLSMVFSILLSPLLFVAGLRLSDLIFTVAGSMGLGFMANVIINKPVTIILKSMKTTPIKAPKPSKLIKYVLVLGLIGTVGVSTVFAIRVYNASVGSHGKVKTIGVAAFSNAACTVPLTQIDWGVLEPGQSVSNIFWLKSTGNIQSTLSMSTSNYVPIGAQQFLTTNWNSTGIVIQPSQVIAVNVTLTVSDTIVGITDFSYDIVISSTG